ncbi:HAD-IA family hydrolase [Primorskyibacter sp. S187A]|uniref:HAD-IA family hydrolase n=1 Tax=Primorskyibacter sp. S187A TaxID=3415130 RepID=UPI003C7BEAC1
MKLIVFDVDGTLVDSQGDILAAMTRAFEGEGLTPPAREAVLSIVGLSLPQAMARLAPQTDVVQQDRLTEGYKDAYVALRAENGVAQSSPLYPGVRAMLDRLSEREDLLLGVATGKSRRGLDKLIAGHGLGGVFVTEQVADFHPSKPHPAMLHSAMAEADVQARDTLMLGDTSFDMDMAHAAGCTGIGVSWGYHPVSALARAAHIIDDIGALDGIIRDIWGMSS